MSAGAVMTATRSNALWAADGMADLAGCLDAESHQRYLELCRRISVGPSMTVVFENARTLESRVREVERMERMYPPATVRRMLNWYASLLPSNFRLCAAVNVQRPGRRPSAGFHGLATAISHGAIELLAGDHAIRGRVLKTQSGDRLLGSSFWIEFAFSADARDVMLDHTLPMMLSVIADGYAWESEPFTWDMRRSLCEDLGC